MLVTRDVILDLLPLYLAGEASPATRRLVDDFLADDPAFGEVVRHEQASLAGDPSRPVLPPDLELRTLRRTRFLLGCQRWVFGLAWFFTAIAFSVRLRFDGGRLQQIRFALADFPIAMVAAALAAGGSWLAYVALRRRTRSFGL